MTSENKGIDKTFWITILIMYFGTCGGLWHVGYWSTFDINYLQYVGLTDIIKNFAIPFLRTAGISIILYFVTNILQFANRQDNPDALYYGRASQTKAGIFLNKWSFIFMTIYFISIILILIYDDYKKYTYLPLYISIPISIYFTNQGLFYKQIVNPDLRNGVINFLVLLPLFAYCMAKMQSLAIYENHSYKVVKTVQLNESDSKNKADKLIGLKFLGSTTDVIFLSEMGNRETTFLNASNVLYISYESITTKK